MLHSEEEPVDGAEYRMEPAELRLLMGRGERVHLAGAARKSTDKGLYPRRPARDASNSLRFLACKRVNGTILCRSDECFCVFVACRGTLLLIYRFALPRFRVAAFCACLSVASWKACIKEADPKKNVFFGSKHCMHVPLQTADAATYWPGRGAARCIVRICRSHAIRRCCCRQQRASASGTLITLLGAASLGMSGTSFLAARTLPRFVLAASAMHKTNLIGDACACSVSRTSTC